MLKKKYGFALMGCGRVAERHAQLLSSGEIDGAELVAVCDPQLDRSSSFQRKHNVPSYGSLKELMAEHAERVDIISVLTESGFHADNTVEAAGYGKHVLVEKPMALTLDDADRMIEVCDNAGVKLFVVKQNRLNKPVQAVRAAFDEGKFGKITMATVRVRWRRDQYYYDQDSWRGTWKMDGGVFANQASHHVDLVQWFLGTPVSVYAITRTALVDIECEDTGVAVIKFESGAIGLVEATTATRPKNLEGSFSLLGSKGTAVIGGFAVNKLQELSFEGEDEAGGIDFDEHSENPPDVYGYGHRKYLQHVVKTLEGAPALVDGLAGRRSLELISAIYESAATGREVQLRFQQKHGKLGLQ